MTEEVARWTPPAAKRATPRRKPPGIVKRLRTHRLFVTGFVLFATMLAMALLADVIATHDPIVVRARNRFKPPSLTNFFGNALALFGIKITVSKTNRVNTVFFDAVFGGKFCHARFTAKEKHAQFFALELHEVLHDVHARGTTRHSFSGQAFCRPECAISPF